MQFARELHDDQLRRLGADARDATERRIVLRRDRLGDLTDGQGGQHAERGLRPDARNAQEEHEGVQLVALREAVERQGVLAHDEVGVQQGLIANVQRARHLGGHRDGEADTANLDDGRLGVDVEHAAAERGDHAVSLRADSDVCSSDTRRTAGGLARRAAAVSDAPRARHRPTRAAQG